MSIEIDWKALTTGPDGLALAETIKDFIHERFQTVTLPRFIRSVHVHSFEFGDEAPTVILKDICDPLDEFYEDSDDEGDEACEASNDGVMDDDDGDAAGRHGECVPGDSSRSQAGASMGTGFSTGQRPGLNQAGNSMAPPSLPSIDTRRPNVRSFPSFVDSLATPVISRSGTPGIPGGTSNLSYFHLPLSANASGIQTPLAAAAGGSGYPSPWSEYHFPGKPDAFGPTRGASRNPLSKLGSEGKDGEPSTRPSTAASQPHAHDFVAGHQLPPASSPTLLAALDPSPNDIQIVLHVNYEGGIRLALTAEILLDYPMPSFVGIPLQLTITGLSFDGVAILAYLKQRGEAKAHICFLGQNDAEALLGSQVHLGDEIDGQAADLDAVDGKLQDGHKHAGHATTKRGGSAEPEKSGNLGGLLREIRVESEIGQRQEGRQSLKNVGKVEKFVLEQVQRIFEDEFVWPSFWTFLV